MRLLLLLIVVLHVVAAQEVPVLEVSDVEFPISNEAAARLDKFTGNHNRTNSLWRIKLEYYDNGYIMLFQFNALKLSYNP